MPGGTDLLIGMERTLRDKEVQVSHLMAVVYEEQNRTQSKQDQVLRLDAERLELGRKLAEMESIKRLHVAELEARNRAMTSELDTARMELDNKIREKRELMQAHAAYIEEMERQHANRVDELDTLVQQYRGTIWSYEAKIEGLEKTLDAFRDTAAAAGAAHAPVDMDQFVTTGEENMDVIVGKNEALLRELEVTLEERTAAETARDLAQNDASSLAAQLADAQTALDAQTQENLQLRDALSAAGVQAPAAPASGAASASAGGASGADVAKGGASATLTSAQAVISQAAGVSSPGDNETAAHYDDLRKKLLHTCVSLLEEFDDQRCSKAKALIETAEGDYE
jgi:chromosome segregation ATPase